MKLTLIIISLCLVNTFAVPTQNDIKGLVNPSESVRASVIGNFLQAIQQGVSNINKVSELFQAVLGAMINNSRGDFSYFY